MYCPTPPCTLSTLHPLHPNKTSARVATLTVQSQPVLLEPPRRGIVALLVGLLVPAVDGGTGGRGGGGGGAGWEGSIKHAHPRPCCSFHFRTFRFKAKLNVVFKRTCLSTANLCPQDIRGTFEG